MIASQVLYYFESNTRSATIIGIVGAGGIGLHLAEQIRVLEWDVVAFLVLMILVAVAAIDWVSSRLRFAIIGRAPVRGAVIPGRAPSCEGSHETPRKRRRVLLYRVAGAGAFLSMLCAPALISTVSPGPWKKLNPGRSFHASGPPSLMLRASVASLMRVTSAS